MNIDIRTLVFVLCFTNLLQVIGIFLQYIINKTYKGIGWWLLGFIALAIGLALLLFRGANAPGANITSIIFTNIFLILGPTFQYIGTMRFLEQKESRKSIIAIFVVLVLTICYFSNEKFDLARWQAFFAAGWAAFSFLTAQGLWVNKIRSITVSAGFLILVLVLNGCFFALRAVLLYTILPADQLGVPTLMPIALFSATFIKGLLLTFGFIIMVNQRLAADLREAKERFELIFQTSPEAVLFIRLEDGQVLDVNEGFTTVTGAARSKIVGRSVFELSFWQTFSEQNLTLEELTRDGYCQIKEIVFQHSNGQPIIATMSANKVNIQGQPHAISIIHDVTVRRQAEFALRQAHDELEQRVSVRTAELAALNATLEQRVLQRTRELSILYDILATASQTTNLKGMMVQTLERIMDVISGTMGAIYLTDEQNNVAPPFPLRLIAQRGTFPPAIWSAINSLTGELGILGHILNQQEPLLIPNIATAFGIKDESNPALALLATTIQAEGRVLGVLLFGCETEYCFKPEDRNLLASIAKQVGFAVQNNYARQQAIVYEERQRLARDLHDSVTQSLYGLVTLTEAGQAQLESGLAINIEHTLIRIGQTARKTLKEMRLYIYNLRPLDLNEEGLVGALQLRLTAVEGRSNIKARLISDELGQLPVNVTNALYHITQEALNNVLKHTMATSVTVYLRKSTDALLLEVIDNGNGFNLQKDRNQGMGLTNMRERAQKAGGIFEITSVIGRGTNIKVSIPCKG